MSVFFITGKPRGGKTYLSVEMIYQELLKPASARPIVTNIGLKLDVIAESLRQDLKLDYTPDLSKRILVLDDVETGEFWEYSLDADGNKVHYSKRKNLKLRQYTMNIPDFEERGMIGAFYVIDEVHIYFPAVFGTKQDNLDDLRFFLTQHGKMNIDVNFITQHVEQCSKILRRLTQEYMNVRNLSREPFMGFRIGNMFRYIRSLNSPASANPAAFESGFKSMDFAKYGAFYDTTAGVGILGSIIKQPAKRGRSLWWITVPIGLFIFCCWYAIAILPAQITRAAHGVSKKGTEVILPNGGHPEQTQKEKTIQQKAASHFIGSNTDNGTNVTLRNIEEPDDTVYCRGYTLLGKNVTVFLSDGRVYYSAWNEVETITHRYVTCLGTNYEIKVQWPQPITQTSYQQPQQQSIPLSTTYTPPQRQQQGTTVTVIGRPRNQARPQAQSIDSLMQGGQNFQQNTY